jgi:putative sigma-54 modulation protein
VHGEGLDHFAAIDVATDRLEAQLRRMKGRLAARVHRNGDRPVPFAVDDDDSEEPQFVRRTQQLAKPMTAEEASLELESRNLAFLLFTDAETMRATVIHRLDSGGYGLIEHQA